MSSASTPFYPNKQVTTGEGAVVVTDNDNYATLLRSLRNHGRDDDAAWPYYSQLGFNYRLGEMNCALGVAQFQRIEELLAKRERAASLYHERLRGLEAIQLLPVDQGSRIGWFVYVIRLSDEVNRDTVMARLEAQGVPSRAYFPAVHLLPHVREVADSKNGDLPNAEAASRTVLALPFHGNLREDEVDYICDTLSRAVA